MSFAARAGCAALVVLAAACSSSSGPAGTAPTHVPPSTSLTAYQPPPSTTTPASTEPATTAPPTGVSSAAAAGDPSIAPEPTGVPGLQAADRFCAAWAAYAGTVQMLAVGSNFGEQPPATLAAAEMYASPVIAEATADIGAGWPAELAAERNTVIDKVIGPMQRREAKAVAALRAAGVGEADIATMGVAWRSVLAARNPDDPTVPRPAVGADVDAKVDAAAAAFAASVPDFGKDPSLLVTADHPLTQAYLAAHCPDLAASGVGDAI